MSKILLGSESPGRRFVLQKMGFLFDSLAPNIEEKSLDKNSEISLQQAIELVKFNSKLKMDQLLQMIGKDHKYELIITSDTTVWANNKIYEKTYDKILATNLLSELTGKTHQVITGVSLYLPEKGKKSEYKLIQFHDTTEVYITDNVTIINLYLQSDDCLGKAGCYGIQGKGSIIINSVKGSIDNVIGLPIQKIIKILEENENNIIMNILKTD
jgi:septum formation protein